VLREQLARYKVTFERAYNDTRSMVAALGEYFGRNNHNRNNNDDDNNGGNNFRAGNDQNGRGFNDDDNDDDDFGGGGGGAPNGGAITRVSSNRDENYAENQHRNLQPSGGGNIRWCYCIMYMDISCLVLL